MKEEFKPIICTFTGIYLIRRFDIRLYADKSNVYPIICNNGIYVDDANTTHNTRIVDVDRVNSTGVGFVTVENYGSVFDGDLEMFEDPDLDISMCRLIEPAWVKSESIHTHMESFMSVFNSIVDPINSRGITQSIDDVRVG